eukprot:6200386-Pleurochrysis_carterae.AAC.1
MGGRKRCADRVVGRLSVGCRDCRAAQSVRYLTVGADHALDGFDPAEARRLCRTALELVERHEVTRLACTVCRIDSFAKCVCLQLGRTTCLVAQTIAEWGAEANKLCVAFEAASSCCVSVTAAVVDD